MIDEPHVPKAGRPWLAIVVVAVAIGLVAGGRILMREDTTGSPDIAPTVSQETARPSGRTVPATVEGTAGLTVEGSFYCTELKVGNRYTGRVEGGVVKNTSGVPLALAFDLAVHSATTSQTVGRRFQMAPDQTAPPFLMASKSLEQPITRCAVKLFSDGDLQAATALAQQAKDAGCTLNDPYPIEGQEHVAPPTRVTYKTTPPTSGRHYAKVAPTGVRSEEIPNEIQVHNLEHGHVGLLFNGGLPPSGLVEAAKTDSNWVFVAPYTMSTRFAFTAWGRSLICDGEAKGLKDLAIAFIKLFKNRAPESIPG